MLPAFSSHRIAFHTIGFCFFLSGFAALLYQTVWLRQFGIYFGTSEQAIAVVLSAYMGGLAFGSWLASRYVNRLRRPVLTYGILELGIALGAMLVPFGFLASQSLFIVLVGQQPQLPSAGGLSQITFQLLSAFTIILIPTTLMGATLPVLTRHAVQRDEEVGPGVGLLYAENTAGAVLGTLVAAFVLMPRMGLWETTVIGIVANAVVFLIIWVLSRSWQSETSGVESIQDSAQDCANIAAPPIKPTQRPRELAAIGHSPASLKYGNSMLPLMTFSGAVSFSYEVLCTRMLGHMLGSSIYAFATMLASFLLGIAIGGGIGAKLATSRERAIKGFIFAQAGAALSGLAMFYSVDQLAARTLLSQDPISLPMGVSIAMASLLPITLFIGMTFPLAIRVVAANEEQASVAAARVYSWNTLGAILGSLMTGFFLLPLLHYAGTTVLAIMANLALAGLAFLLWRPRAAYGGVVLASLLTSLAFRPQAPEHLLWASSMGGQVSRGPIIFSQVGRSATVTVNHGSGALMLRTNGLPEAGIKLPGAPLREDSDSVWLGAMASLLRPKAKSMLVVGFGGGSALEHIPSSIRRIDVCELEPAVIQANRLIGRQRRRDPLSDPRVRVVLNDARSALQATSRKYDAIVSQPSHPWTAGASHLYTQEFAEIVKQHLSPSGVFIQWIDQSFVDQHLLSSMGKTLLNVFSHVRLYRPTYGTLLFAGSDDPIEPELASHETEKLVQKHQKFYHAIGVESTESLLAILAADHPAMLKMTTDAPPITDNRNLLAMRGPIVRRIQDSPNKLLEKFSPLRPEVSPLRSQLPQLDLSYVIRRRHYILRGEGAQLAELLSTAAQEEFLALVSFSQANSTTTLEHLDRSQEHEADRENALFLRVQLLSNQAASESELTPLIARLPEPSRSTALALQAFGKQDFAAIKKLDAAMSKATPRHFCFSTALQLRAQWRLQDDSAKKKQHQEQALRILDSLLPYTKDLNTLSMRFITAMLLKREMDAIGTCEEIAFKMSAALAHPDQAVAQAKPAELLGLVNRTLNVVEKLHQNSVQANFRTHSLLNELRSLQSQFKP